MKRFTLKQCIAVIRISALVLVLSLLALFII